MSCLKPDRNHVARKTEMFLILDHYTINNIPLILRNLLHT